MKRERDLHRLIESVDLKVNFDADREVLQHILRASRESVSPPPQGGDFTILLKAKFERKIVFWRLAGCMASVSLIVLSWIAFVSNRDVADLKTKLELARHDITLARQEIAMAQQKAAMIPTDTSTTINLYLKEHQDVVARHASFNSSVSQPTQMQVNQDDILYYEFFDDGPDSMRPGIIVRGSSPQRETGSPDTPVISNGRTLTLSEARQLAAFDLVSPSWLRPGYALDQIRQIEGRDALQLLYTDGINSVSLFEQPVNGQRMLEPRDFREYAVYSNTEQGDGTILAWRDNERSYVLVGNANISQLMGVAQSISNRINGRIK